MSRVESYPADSFVVAAGSDLHLLRRWPLPPPKEGGAPPPPAPRGCGAPAFDEVVVSHGSALTAAEWNRNNRVVAAGCADGTVQLLYACGKTMYSLPRGGAPHGGAVTSLSWSAGSKRLAAGCATGDVHIHDIQTKGAATLGGHLGGVTAVQYQHDDKFLAVASNGGSVVLYPDAHRGGAGGAAAVPLAASARDASARLCLALAAGDDALVAAGSARGGVAVWDVPTFRLQEEYEGQHRGERVNALSFVPLKPGWIYSAGGDGRVCLQDRKAGPGHVSAIPVGAPCTALTVREDHALVGVGTAEGVVKLYDPRHTRQPLNTIRLPSGQPVAALQWQHRFASLASRHHSKGASDGVRAPPAAAAAPAPHAAAPPAAAAAHAAAVPPPHRASSAGLSAASIGSHIVPAAGATPAAARTPASTSLPAAAPAAAAVAPAHQPSTSVQLAPAGAGADSSQGTPQMLQQAASAAPAASATPAVPSVPPAGTATLQVTPLAGVAPRYGAAAVAAAAAAAGHTTPAQQRAAAPSSSAAAVDAQLQPAITPLTGHARSSGAAPPAPRSQLRQAAPVPLEITPLAAPPASRLPAGFAAVAPAPAAELPAPRPLSVSPLSSAGSQGAGQASHGLCISPLPGMQPPAASPRQPAAQRAGRSVLGERSTNNDASPGSPRMLPRLPSPLPAQAEPPALLDSPSFAENLPLPSPPAQHGGGKPAQQQQQEPAHADTHKIKASAAAAEVAVAELQPTPSGSFQPWTIGAVPGGEMASGSCSDEVPAALLAAQRAGASTAAASGMQPCGSGEFSFAAAQRSAEQLGAGGAAWAVGCQAAGDAAGGAAAAAALQDNLLALHLDMLSQFQEQQACMGRLVGQVTQQNEALAAKVAALEQRLAAMATRRDDFLWL